MVQLDDNAAHSFQTISLASLSHYPFGLLSVLPAPPKVLTSNVILPCCRAEQRSQKILVHTACARGYHYRPCLLLHSARSFWQFSGSRRPPLNTEASINTQQRDHTWGGFSVCLSDLVHGSGPLVILLISQILNFPFWNFLWTRLKYPPASVLWSDKNFKPFKAKLICIF